MTLGGIIGLSREQPPRVWLHVPFLGEIRFYLWGIELFVGPDWRFLSLEVGTLGCRAMWVRER